MFIPDGDKIDGRKRRPVAVLVIPLLFGLLGLLRVMQSPQFESYRTLHVIQLLVSGACFGVVLMTLILMVVRPLR